MNWFRNLKRQAEIRKLKARRTKDAEIMADEIKFPQPESWSPVSLDWGCMVIQRPLPVIRGGCVTDMDVDDMCQTLILVGNPFGTETNSIVKIFCEEQRHEA